MLQEAGGVGQVGHDAGNLLVAKSSSENAQIHGSQTESTWFTQVDVENKMRKTWKWMQWYAMANWSGWTPLWWFESCAERLQKPYIIIHLTSPALLFFLKRGTTQIDGFKLIFRIEIAMYGW